MRPSHVYFLRHALSVLILPVTVVIVVPVWIARRYGVQFRWPTEPLDVSAAGAGLLVGAAGLTLFAASLHHFATEGFGTLAPWDPPRRLVVRGPYRYVRNPMIAGVSFMLIGISLLLRSTPHAQWALAFIAVNAVFIITFEEPQLEGRFGDDYRHYRSVVPRLIPRMRPWSPDDTPGPGS
jgi:protein-S-isoprenylcysteine O-methyltransferase Ste14